MLNTDKFKSEILYRLDFLADRAKDNNPNTLLEFIHETKAFVKKYQDIAWIRVEDELPKQEQIVRAYNPHWREKYNHMTFIFLDGDFVAYPYMYKVVQPTYWQPLSLLPQGEKQ